MRSQGAAVAAANTEKETGCQGGLLRHTVMTDDADERGVEVQLRSSSLSRGRPAKQVGGEQDDGYHDRHARQNDCRDGATTEVLRVVPLVMMSTMLALRL